MHLVRTARPTATCIIPDQVRANKRVLDDSEDALIELWIKAAEDLIEKATNRAIMRQTFKLSVPIIRPQVTLFRPPMEGEITLVSATSTMAGFDTAHDVSTLKVGLASMLPLVSFPAIRTVDSGSMVVEYETGVEDPADVPPGIQQAVLLLASYYYSNREAANLDPRGRGGTASIPLGVEKFIGLYRIPNVSIAVNEA